MLSRLMVLHCQLLTLEARGYGRNVHGVEGIPVVKVFLGLRGSNQVHVRLLVSIGEMVWGVPHHVEFYLKVRHVSCLYPYSCQPVYVRDLHSLCA